MTRPAAGACLGADLGGKPVRCAAAQAVPYQPGACHQQRQTSHDLEPNRQVGGDGMFRAQGQFVVRQTIHTQCPSKNHFILGSGHRQAAQHRRVADGSNFELLRGTHESQLLGKVHGQRVAVSKKSRQDDKKNAGYTRG